MTALPAHLAALVNDAASADAVLSRTAARLVSVRDGAASLAEALRLIHPEHAAEAAKVAARALVVQPGSAAAARFVLPEADFEDLFGGAPIVRDRVRDIVRQRRVPADFPVAGVLAIASIACAARLRSEFTHSNGAPIQFYPHEFVVLAAESGAGKSAAMDDTGFLALPAWVSWLDGQTSDEVFDDKAERRAAQRALSSGKALVREDARRHERRLAQPHVATPDPLTDDTSPAQFVRDAQASGFLALAVEEGKELLDAFVRGETETMGPLLMAWDGRRKNRRRVGDEREGRGAPRFPDLHAAGLVVVQPTVLRGKDQADRDRLREVSKRGLFPRCALVLPRDITADEELAPPDPLPGADDRARAYFDLIRGLLQTQVGDHPLQPRAKGTDGEQVFGGWSVSWEPDAAAVVSAFDSEWRAKAAAGGVYHGDELRAPQARRLSHHASRVAVLLAVLRAGRLGPDIVVTADDAARASRFARDYLWPHADAVLGRACETPVESAMSAVWAHLVEQGAQTRRQLSRKFPKLDEGERAADRRTLLDAALDFLERRGKVEKEEQARGSTLYKPLVGHVFADRNDLGEAA